MSADRSRPQWVGRAILSMLLACGWLATLWAMPARAAGTTYTVPAGAVADDPNDNVCSLVEAVTAATTNAAYHECPAGSATDPDTITLAAGTYTLTSPLPETFPSQDGGLVIAGAGLNATTVQYNNPQGDWLWAFGDITVTVQDLTLDGGANSPGLQPTGATFTLRNARLQHFGMALLIGPSGGTVTVQNTRFTQNGPSASYEGAIGIDNNEPATLIVQNSQFDGNQAGSGGAIWVWPFGGTSATVQITGSTFTQNQGLEAEAGNLCTFASGGAIWINPTSHAQVTVDQSTFQGNTTAGYGGAISGPVTVTNSTFSQNHADKEGGALALVTHYSASGSIQVSGSTFTDNTADEGGAIFLGGCSDASLSMVNSTISHNTVSNGEGSAIYLSGPNPQASLAFVTLADNSGPTALDVGEAPHGTFRLKNVVLADPNVPECGPLDNGSGTGLTVQTAGAVLADDASCGSGVTVVPNLRSTLGNLAYNGGPTPTHALLDGSPAIAAVPSGQCTDSANSPVTQDQRGQPRPNPSGTPCDAGAYESASGPSATPSPSPSPTPTPTPTPVPKPDLVVSALDARPRAARGGPLRATVTVRNQGTAPAPASTVALLFSADPTPSADDLQLGTCGIGPLGVGQQASCQVTVRALPRTPHQQGYLVAVADWGNGVVELNETNNTLAQPFLIQ